MSGLTSEHLLPEAEARLRSAALTPADVAHIMGPDEKVAPPSPTTVSTFPFLALVGLARAVIEHRPAYAPHVTAGTQHVQEFLWAKQSSWHRAVMSADGQMLAHVGVKVERTGRGLEMIRLMVHPDWQRQGLASRVVDLAAEQFGTRLHAVVGPNTPSHHLLLHLGWSETGTTFEPGEPDECVVLSCTREAKT